MKPLRIILLSLFVLLVLSYNTNAQIDNISINHKLDHQIRFSITGLMQNTLTFNQMADWENGQCTIDGECGKLEEIYPKSFLAPSAEISLSYYKHIKNNMGINIGIGLTALPMWFGYRFDNPETSAFSTSTYEKMECYWIEYPNYDILTFPLSFQKLIPKSNSNKYYNMEIGAKLNYYLNTPYRITTGEIIDDKLLFEMNLYDTRKETIMSYFMKIGFIKLNRKMNTFHFNLVCNFSFSEIGIGKYEFSNLGRKNWGYVSQNINYIGFEFSYGLSLFK